MKKRQWCSGKNCAAYVSSQAETKLIPAMMNGSLASLRGLAAFFGICIVTVVAAVLILCDYDNLVQRWRKAAFIPGADGYFKICVMPVEHILRHSLLYWH